MAKKNKKQFGKPVQQKTQFDKPVQQKDKCSQTQQKPKEEGEE
ncbi:MAG: hypothetical protein ABIA97_03610 [Candidatus Omnitrophota bacterium]